jgi:outer membrane usher protein
MHTGNHGQAQRADHAPRRRDLPRTRRMSLLLLLLVPCACPDSRLERMKSGGRATVAAGEPPVPAVVAAGVAAGMEVPAPGSLVLAHPVPPSSRPVADELAARGSIDPAGLVPPPRPAVAGVVAIPPPEPAPSLVEDIQYLELVVNGARSNFVAPVHVKGGLLAIDAADLRQAGLPLPGAAGSGRVWLDSVPQLSVRLDTAQLMLHLAVPPEWLPMQHVGSRAARAFAPAQASSGALLNYGIHGQHSPQADSLSAWTELRLFGTWGVLSTTAAGRTGGGGVVRHDTRFTRVDQQRALTFEAGDLVTRGTAWSSAVRLGGVQVSRDFSVRPDLVTYPLPEFAGEAALPGTAELFINGYRADAAQVQPGPFQFTGVPFINGAGEAVVTVTDALGRQFSTMLPFYVAGELLRPGLSDFSLAAGALRRSHGLRSFDYGQVAASAHWRHGLNEVLTLETRAEAASSLRLAGVGTLLQVGNLGVLNLAANGSGLAGEKGWQLSAGYRYSRPGASLAVQHSRHSADFNELATLGREGAASRTTTLTAAWQLAGSSLGAGYFDITGRDRQRTRLLNLSWGVPLGRQASLHASGNRELGRGGWTAGLTVMASIGARRGTASAGVEQGSARDLAWRASWQRTVPTQGGLGFSASVHDGVSQPRSGQAEAVWRSRVAELRAGVQGGGGMESWWGDASGSLVMMDGALLPANRVGDGFVLVNTGQPGVGVRYENQPVGRSDARGRLLVPWATAYYPGRYVIDALDLPLDLVASQTEQRVAVARGSGYRVDFAVRRVSSARVVLRDLRGEPLPAGTKLRIEGAGDTYVGWEGFAYLEDVSGKETIEAHLPEGGICRASLALDTAGDAVQVRTVICQ